MKKILKCLAIGTVAALSVGTCNTYADLEVSASFRVQAVADFYTPLETHGAWIEVGSYGRCWRPARIAVGWRPYCYGQWVWTDCGWYWQSDEPWAWACYHYGYWVIDPAYGWVWVPGIEWGPAWVTWRYGGGYIGWSPWVPAHVVVTLGAPHFVFVSTSRFREPMQPSRVIVNNTTIINNTTVINNIRRETRSIQGGTSQKVVVNDGPGVEVVQKGSGKEIKKVSIQEAANRTAVPAELKTKGNPAKGRETPAINPVAPRKSAPATGTEPWEKRPPPGKNLTPDPSRKNPPAPGKSMLPPPETPKPKPKPPTEHPQTAPRPDNGKQPDGLPPGAGREHPKKTDNPVYSPVPPPSAGAERRPMPKADPAAPTNSLPPQPNRPGNDQLGPSPAQPPAPGGPPTRPLKPEKDKKKKSPQTNQ